MLFSVGAYGLHFVLGAGALAIGGLTGPLGPLIAGLYYAPGTVFSSVQMSGQKRELLEAVFAPAVWGFLVVAIWRLSKRRREGQLTRSPMKKGDS
jgi:hypothetical protein